MGKLNCILLVDDDGDSNFFHTRMIHKMDCAEEVKVVLDGEQALDFLQTPVDGVYPTPELILLDINMPKINGWEFLVKYEKLPEDQKGKIVIIMLTTSLNPDDKAKAESIPYLKGFVEKYLSKESLGGILVDNFPGRF